MTTGYRMTPVPDYVQKLTEVQVATSNGTTVESTVVIAPKSNPIM